MDSKRCLELYKTATTLEVVEEDIRFTKLIFPVKEDATWNGNANNTLGEWEYEYTYSDRAETINGTAFDNVLMVTQKDDKNKNAIHREYYIEKYAKEIGLVYREIKDLRSSVVIIGVPVEQRITSGVIYKLTYLLMDMNKIKTIIFACLLFSITNELLAQFPGKYWVKFKDKNFSPYSVGIPSAYLSARSIARRANQGIGTDITDIPVNQTYINQVNATGAQVFQRSKWMNAAVVIINNASQLSAINSLTCVLSSAPVGKYIKTKSEEELSVNAITPSSNKQSSVSSYSYGPSFTQVNQIGADCMHELGFRGQGIVIAVIDAGFENVNTNPVFDSLRNEGRLLGTRDYVARQYICKRRLFTWSKLFVLNSR
jgi:hypothetical protein